jgi:ABC-type Mn2+/Zn2+ transport system ATPase subunit
VIRLDGVRCGYGAQTVLSDVTLAIDEHQFVGVLGPSGSGKTTLLRVLLGTVRPRAGRVERRAGLRIGYVPQVETVDWSFPVTVNECVMMARDANKLRWPWASRAERTEVVRVLDRLGIGDLGRRHIRELSGGQQQRVFIARALLGEPELLLLDEPMSGVDARTRHEMLHLLDDLHRAGTSIVLSTHDLNGIASHLPHLVCLAQTVIAEGAPAEVLTSTVLEATFGARMEVLHHAGVPIVLDHHHGVHEAAPLGVHAS